MSGDDPRLVISQMLSAGWTVVGYSTNRQVGEDPTAVDWVSHHVLLAKDSQLRSYEVLTEDGGVLNVTESELAPGVAY